MKPFTSRLAAAATAFALTASLTAATASASSTEDLVGSAVSEVVQSSQAEESGSSLSSKASAWDTTKHVGEAAWKEARGEQGYTSSFRQGADTASSQITPDRVAGAVTAAQANPAGAAAAVAGLGSAAKPVWDTMRTDAANDWPVGRTFDTFVGLTVGGIVAILAAVGVLAANERGIIELPDIPGFQWPKLPKAPTSSAPGSSAPGSSGSSAPQLPGGSS